MEAPVSPQVVAAAPTLEKLSGPRSLNSPTQLAVAPATAPVIQNPTPLLASAAVKQNPAASAALLPLPVAESPAQGAAPAPTQHAPVVAYRDGQLTINAENVTLASVLQMVAEKTGAIIDVPAGSGQERIFEHSGPGRPNDVLTQLLNGTHFNFIIVNSPQHPFEPTQVLLSLQRADTEAPPATNTASVTPATTTSPYWTPPENTAPVVPPQFDSTLKAPTEALSPEALGDLMKAKAREILEKAQQDAPH
jgi:hypothetical protein